MCITSTPVYCAIASSLCFTELTLKRQSNKSYLDPYCVPISYTKRGLLQIVFPLTPFLSFLLQLLNGKITPSIYGENIDDIWILFYIKIFGHPNVYRTVAFQTLNNKCLCLRNTMPLVRSTDGHKVKVKLQTGQQ